MQGLDFTVSLLLLRFYVTSTSWGYAGGPLDKLPYAALDMCLYRLSFLGIVISFRKRLCERRREARE